MRSDQPAELEKLWEEHPDVIRDFLAIRPQYEQLCSEVKYILEKRLQESEIEVSTVTSRAKTLPSFAEKTARKGYDDPLADTTDLAGVRVVYLYRDDQLRIETIIENEFRVVEKIDKVGVREADEFGYGALHYLVKLGKKSSGARYDDLKALMCEIQVRTVLQDAWAVIDHHLSYKNEADIPKQLRRKLNSLSGLFETADDQFDHIRQERTDYLERVRKLRDDPAAFLSQELNLDTFAEYIKWKFPDKAREPDDRFLLRVFRALQQYDIGSLEQIDNLVERTKPARTAIGRENKAMNGATEVNRALALVVPKHRLGGHFGDDARERFKKYEHLIRE